LNTQASKPRYGFPGRLVRKGFQSGRFFEIMVPVSLISLIAGANPLFALGLGVFAFSVYRLLISPDRPFMIRWLIVFVALLQWVVAPGVAYNVLLVHSRYGMWVPQADYMLFAVPAVIAFAVGVFFVGNNTECDAQRDALANMPEFNRKFPDLPLLLMFIAIIASVGAILLPDSLAFAAYLLSNLKYSAVILLLFSHRQDRFLWIGTIAGLLFIEAATTSLFHDAILWSMLIGGAYIYRIRMKTGTKFVFAILFLFVVTLINSVKSDYRDEIWGTSKAPSATVYFDMTIEKIGVTLDGDVDFSEMFEGMVIRLNQGRIISRIMLKMPDQIPYLSGQSIRAGIVAALVPRFLMPDKARAGGHENFQKMTGWMLGKNTSMGVSVLGEAYGNFGVLGGIVFMGLFGLALGWFLLKVTTLGLGSNPLLIALLPCVFIYVIKAETDFVTVANFLVKASVLYAAVFIVLTRGLNFRFRRWKAEDGGVQVDNNQKAV